MMCVGRLSVQTNDDRVVVQGIQERAAGAVSAGDRQRPARSMHDEAEFVPGRIDLPEFLETDRVVLRVRAVGQLVALDQALAEVTAATFGKQRVLGTQSLARRVAVLRLALVTDAQLPDLPEYRREARRERGVQQV